MAVCSTGGFMPQAIFGNLCEYRLTGTALAMILYAWVSYLRRLDMENCILLAVGIAVCALSYYNAYGWYSAVFLLFTVLLCREEAFHREFVSFQQEEQDRSSYCLRGWWFIRNAVLYKWRSKETCANVRKICSEWLQTVTNRPQAGMELKDIILYQIRYHTDSWYV